MTGNLFLDWATLAVSLFNTILLLWLGLTVLLNAERRTWGIWLAGGGLLMGGAFFISHSAILGDAYSMSHRLDVWWHVGWLPVVVLPYAWYVLMLWYAGFWSGNDRMRRRQRPWLMGTTLLFMTLLALFVFANPLPSFWQVAQLDLAARPSIGGVPILFLVYPWYALLCIALSLDTLRRPDGSAEGTSSFARPLARRRARPWLAAASIVLLLVALLVALVTLGVSLMARVGVTFDVDARDAILPYSARRNVIYLGIAVAWLDLVMASLTGIAVMLLGQAVVTYEVFTGRSLPRRGFFRHWRRTVILAAGYSGVVSVSFMWGIRPIYSLLLTLGIMVAFYALLVWRSFADRERYIDHLRPFVASQRLYERLLSPSAPPDLDVQSLFEALCADVLDARLAILAAVGPMAPFFGSPLVYPRDRTAGARLISALAARFDSPQTVYVPLDPDEYYGATWAVSLWSERGLIGVLLLGEKRGGGLYTQEEIEIARASGERLVDVQAGAEMARRLMALQRQRLAQSQVIDQQTRRVLHDEVLPRLHAAMLTLGEEDAHADAVAGMTEVHRQISDLLRDMPTASAPQVTRLGPLGALRRTVQEAFARAFDRVEWTIDPQAERQARAIPTLTAEVLFYAAREAVRNAARHGRGEGQAPLHLSISATWDDGLTLVIQDDGVGLSGQRVPEDDGRGLALHSTMMAVIGGTLALESMPGAYTRVTLRLPQKPQ